MAKKSVSYVNLYFPPFRGAGAVRAHSFVTFLYNKGHSVRVFAPKNVPKLDFYSLVKIFAPMATNKDSFIKRLTFELLYAIELFFKIIFSKKTDYAILSSPSFIVTYFATIAFMFKGTKIIIDVRDMYPEVLFKLGIIRAHSILGRILSSMETFVYKKSQYVLVVSQSYREVVSKKVGAAKVVLVQNGYDKDTFFPSKQKYTHFTLCFHGNLGKLYDIALLNNIMEDIFIRDKSIKFLVIGSGAKEHLLNKNIKNLEYIDHVNHDQIGQYLSKCHVGLSLTLDNAFSKQALPVKVFEYIGLGLPVIVTPRGEAGTLVSSNGFGYEFTGNVEEIVQTILTLKSDEKTYVNLVENMSKKREQFTREQQLEKMYNRIF